MPISKKIKVSICIPAYNSEKYLKKCLDSVIHQNLKEIEIIVTNDASSDNSDKIIREYQKKDKRIVYLKNKTNQGACLSRLKMINQSRGEYLGFVDSDDWVDTGTFEKMYNCAKDEMADMVVCDLYHIFSQNKDSWKKIDYTSWKKKYRDKKLKDSDMVIYNVKEGFYHIGGLWCNKFWKSDLLKNKNDLFKKIAYGEDFYTITKLLFSNPDIKISVVPEPLYYCFYNEKNYNYVEDLKTIYLDLHSFFIEKKCFKAIEYFSQKILREKNFELVRFLSPPITRHKLKAYYQSLKQLDKVYNFKTKGKILLKLAKISQIGSILFLTRFPLLATLILLDFRYTVKTLLKVINILYIQKITHKF